MSQANGYGPQISTQRSSGMPSFIDKAARAKPSLGMKIDRPQQIKVDAGIRYSMPNIGQKGSNRTAHGAGLHFDAPVRHS